MKIGILGSGMVGQALAGGFLKVGHEVRIGTAHPSKDDLLKWARSHNAEKAIATFAETAAFGEVIFLCTNWNGTQEVIHAAGKTTLDGKILVDVTNPLDGKGPDAHGRLSFKEVQHSGGFQVQDWLPRSKVVKALNSVGSPMMDHPHYTTGQPTMFIAGNDEEAKKTTAHLLHELGWSDTLDIGRIDMSDSLEELCRLWCAVGFRTGSWTHAFSLLRK